MTKNIIFLLFFGATCCINLTSSSNQYVFKLLKSYLDITTTANQLFSPLSLKITLLSLTSSSSSNLTTQTQTKLPITDFLYTPTELTSRKQNLLSQYNYLIDTLSSLCNASKGRKKYDCRRYLSRMRLPEVNLTRLNSVQKVEKLFGYFDGFRSGGGEEINRLDALLFVKRSEFGDVKEKGKIKGRMEPFWVDEKEGEEKRLKELWRTNFSILSPQLLPPTHQHLSILQFRQTFAPVFSSTSTTLDFTSTSGQITTVEALTSSNAFGYYYSSKLRSSLLAIPYLNPKYTLVIIKPDPGTALRPVLKYLSTPESKLPSYLEKLNQNLRPLTLTIPKFFGENTINLTRILEKSNLTNLELDSGVPGSPSSVKIDEIRQLIYYENLVGLEEPEVTDKFSDNRYYLPFNVDSPFIYFVTSEVDDDDDGALEIVLAGYFVKVI